MKPIQELIHSERTLSVEWAKSIRLSNENTPTNVDNNYVVSEITDEELEKFGDKLLKARRHVQYKKTFLYFLK